jgi:uncharacterized protein (TIGR02466 family)
MTDYIKTADAPAEINMSQVMMFPTPLYRVDDLPNVNRHAILEVCETRRQFDSGRVVSNRNGWQSSDLVEAEYKHLPIVSMWDACIEISKKIGEESGLSNKYEHSVGTSWININGKRDDYNQQHCHPGTYLACVYYVSVPEGSGDIVFCDPRAGHASNVLHHERITGVNCVEVIVSPKQGELILFPGWLYHFVKQNDNDEERITIATNIVLR